MDLDEMDQMTGGDTAPDAVYRWTIRFLYAGAIALNLWVMWEMVADETDTAVVKAKARSWWDRMAAPFHREGQVKREVGPMIWEAQRIVEEANGNA